MADPWRILGLQSDTADEKQVRSAYARLLKVHRPDQDPEGFQQLRTAYQQALDWLQRRSSPEMDDWDDDDDFAEEEDVVDEVVPEKPPPVVPAASKPSPLPPLPSSWAPGAVPVLPHKLDQEPQTKPKIPQRPDRNWPREWSYSLESLDRALNHSDQRFDGISFALKALASDVVEYGIPPSALECILSDAFHANAALFGATAPVIILSRLLQGGCAGFLKGVLDAMEHAGNQVNIAMLAQRLDDCLGDGLSPRTAEVFFRAATLTALHKPFIAQSIARKLRRSLDASSHAAKFDRLNAAITRGMALRDLTPVHRSFWSQRLDQPESLCNWKADLPGQALAAVVLLGNKWVGCPLVKGAVPAEVWKAAWKGRWFQVTVYGLVKMLHPRNLTVTGFAALGGMLLLVGGNLAYNLTPAPKFNPPQHSKIEVDPAERQREEAFRKHLRELKEQYEKQQQAKEKEQPKAR
jgi:hypothetical protein